MAQYCCKPEKIPKSLRSLFRHSLARKNSELLWPNKHLPPNQEGLAGPSRSSPSWLKTEQTSFQRQESRICQNNCRRDLSFLLKAIKLPSISTTITFYLSTSLSPSCCDSNLFLFSSSLVKKRTVGYHLLTRVINHMLKTVLCPIADFLDELSPVP